MPDEPTLSDVLHEVAGAGDQCAFQQEPEVAMMQGTKGSKIPDATHELSAAEKSVLISVSRIVLTMQSSASRERLLVRRRRGNKDVSEFECGVTKKKDVLLRLGAPDSFENQTYGYNIEKYSGGLLWA